MCLDDVCVACCLSLEHRHFRGYLSHAVAIAACLKPPLSTIHHNHFAVQVDVPRFMSDGQRLAELIQAVKLQHQQEQLQELLESEE